MQDKSLSGYAPVHWAAHKGYHEMLQLLLSYGALVTLKDKHGSLPKKLASSKGYNEIVATIEAAEKAQAKKASSSKDVKE